MPQPDPRSLASTRIRKRKRDASPSGRVEDTPLPPPGARPFVVVEIEGSDVEDELEIEKSDEETGVEEETDELVSERSVQVLETEGSDVEDDEPFAPDQYPPGLHYYVSITHYLIALAGADSLPIAQPPLYQCAVPPRHPAQILETLRRMLPSHILCT